MNEAGVEKSWTLARYPLIRIRAATSGALLDRLTLIQQARKVPKPRC